MGGFWGFSGVWKRRKKGYLVELIFGVAIHECKKKSQVFFLFKIMESGQSFPVYLITVITSLEIGWCVACNDPSH